MRYTSLMLYCSTPKARSLSSLYPVAFMVGAFAMGFSQQAVAQGPVDYRNYVEGRIVPPASLAINMPQHAHTPFSLRVDDKINEFDVKIDDLKNKAPFRRRYASSNYFNRKADQVVQPEDWDAEPESPTQVDVPRLGRALRRLCGRMPSGRATQYAEYIDSYATMFDVDPFVLGALVFRKGRCNPRHEELGSVGLTGIQPRMYASHLKKGVYRYFRFQDNAWVAYERPLTAFAFVPSVLRRAEPNIYYAAALLGVWKEQHDSVDAAFEQVPHRHHVSHFMWGDKVRSARAEDRVLQDRRRLLQYYGDFDANDSVERYGIEWGNPLDGGTRVISSFIGAHRDGGARRHRGIDVEAVFGEPVRAVADGVVQFAGADLPGRGRTVRLTPATQRQVSNSRLGNGGRFVCITHTPDVLPSSESNDPASVRSCYMHLNTFDVVMGQRVQRGEVIGTVGRTGMKISAPHLHFEMHAGRRLLNPAKVLNPLLIGRMPKRRSQR